MKKAKKSTGKRVFLTILCVVLALVLVVGIGASAWIFKTMNLINRDTTADVTLSDEEIESILLETEPEDETVEGVEMNEEDIDLSTENVDILEDNDNILNIMLIGQDRRENQKRQRSDAMILCTLNLEKKTLVLTSFLRDTYVVIPDWNGKQYGKNRLNVNYAIGGMEMLDQCLKDNFGVVVDYNVEVDFFSFAKVVDLMGGVDIELTQAEAGHLNYVHGIGNRLKPGMNHLDGDLALGYSRIRKLDSDFGRTNRQRKVLLSLLEKVKTMSLVDANEMISEVFPMVTTDMTNAQIIEVAVKALPVLAELQVTTQHIPADGTYLYGQIPGMSAIVADMDANRQLLKDTIG